MDASIANSALWILSLVAAILPVLTRRWVVLVGLVIVSAGLLWLAMYL